MSSPPTVVFRVDASERIGSGHIVRCLALASSLVRRNYSCLFISRDMHRNGEKRIESEGHKLRLTRAPRGVDDSCGRARWKEDAAETAEAMETFRPEWLVVDQYELDWRWEMAIRPMCTRILAIDDLANRPHDVDLLLDQNLGRSATRYLKLLKRDAKCLLGTRYALLRPQFAHFRPRSLKRRLNPELGSILISMGGTDPGGLTTRILQFFAEDGADISGDLVVVMGSSTPSIDDVRDQILGMNRRCELMVDVENMAELMTNADLVIGAAGSTAWECSCLGVPAIMFVTAENQEVIASALRQEGAASILDARDFSPSLLRAEFSRIRDEHLLREFSRRSAKLVDGLGADRVAAEMCPP